MRQTAAMLAVLAGLCLAAGCATVLEGTRQSIAVETRSAGAPVAGVRCMLRNDQGVAWLTTPGVATVPFDRSDLKVVCSSAGFEERDEVARAEVKPAVLGNLLVGGLVGFGVDHFGGGGYRYPAAVVVELTARPGASAAPDLAADRVQRVALRARAAASLDELRAVELVRRAACEPAGPPALQQRDGDERHYTVPCGDGRVARVLCQPSECRYRALGE